MKLFELKDWELNVTEEAWGLEPFKKILKRDKSKDKATALKEMLFIYFYCDVKSDYLITSEKDRISEIKKDIKLPDSWKMDSVIKEAVDYYSSFETITESLYKKAVNGANAVGDYLDKAEVLLNERDKMDKPIYKTADITRALKDVKIIMRDLKEAEREVIKEKEDSSKKKSGSRSHNTFESGLI
jgi:hypothetical protein